MGDFKHIESNINKSRLFISNLMVQIDRLESGVVLDRSLIPLLHRYKRDLDMLISNPYLEIDDAYKVVIPELKADNLSGINIFSTVRTRSEYDFVAKLIDEKAENVSHTFVENLLTMKFDKYDKDHKTYTSRKKLHALLVDQPFLNGNNSTKLDCASLTAQQIGNLHKKKVRHSSIKHLNFYVVYHLLQLKKQYLLYVYTL